jgi:membrane protein implicated in regulation of membrane protease activity
MEVWILWLALAVIFLIVEGLTVEVISIWFSGASIVSMILDLCGLDLIWQLISFIVVSILLILLTRPIITKYLKKNESKTNVDSLIGQTAIVTKEILPDNRGEAKIKSQYWLAISADNNLIEADTKVSIVAIEGAKLIVRKISE